MQTDILICGGGASGLAAAIVIRQLRPDLRVCIAERNSRIGKKILVTGNGRCNLGNVFHQKGDYYGTITTLLSEVFANTIDTKTFFANMGLYCREDNEGRLYPHSNQAASVLDALRFTAQHLGVEVRCDCKITDLQKRDLFYAQASQDEIVAHAVIMTSGGLAAPKTGSDGNTLTFLKKMGHHSTTLQPALTNFSVCTDQMRFLKGARIPALVTALDANEKKLATEQGEVQFTERGISGICVMNLSAMCFKKNPVYLSMHLLPKKKPEQILQMLWEVYAIRAQWKCEDFLTGLFPKKIATFLLRQCMPELLLSDPVCHMTPSDLEALVNLFQDWRFPISGRGSWQDAQVTAGGIPAEELRSDLQSKKVCGLFFAGEILDLHGKCGGYNLDWAWRSGQYAAQSVIAFLSHKQGRERSV